MVFRRHPEILRGPRDILRVRPICPGSPRARHRAHLRLEPIFSSRRLLNTPGPKITSASTGAASPVAKTTDNWVWQDYELSGWLNRMIFLNINRSCVGEAIRSSRSLRCRRKVSCQKNCQFRPENGGEDSIRFMWVPHWLSSLWGLPDKQIRCSFSCRRLWCGQCSFLHT